jgi:hypothetical protein
LLPSVAAGQRFRSPPTALAERLLSLLEVAAFGFGDEGADAQEDEHGDDGEPRKVAPGPTEERRRNPAPAHLVPVVSR